MTTAAERRRLGREIDAYLDAAANVRASLLEVEARLERIKALAAEGTAISELLATFPEASTVAASLAGRLKALQTAQFGLRRQIVALGRGEGLSLAQLAGFWGISRQLAYRYVKDGSGRGT